MRFETAEERIAITPPFRFEHWEQADRIETAPLREHLAVPRLVGLLVVRLGGYGAGVYADEKLVSGRHGVRFVKNRNKKGGSSSNRFRRRRVEQARDAYDRAARWPRRSSPPTPRRSTSSSSRATAPGSNRCSSAHPCSPGCGSTR